MTKHFTDDNFQKEVLEASRDKAVLVDFFAVWCGPCQMMAPVIDELAQDLKDKAIVGKLNTEEAQKTASTYGIMSIPTMLIFKDGAVKETIVGMRSKDALKEILSKY